MFVCCRLPHGLAFVSKIIIIFFFTMIVLISTQDYILYWIYTFRFLTHAFFVSCSSFIYFDIVRGVKYIKYFFFFFCFCFNLLKKIFPLLVVFFRFPVIFWQRLMKIKFFFWVVNACCLLIRHNYKFHNILCKVYSVYTAHKSWIDSSFVHGVAYLVSFMRWTVHVLCL